MDEMIDADLTLDPLVDMWVTSAEQVLAQRGDDHETTLAGQIAAWTRPERIAELTAWILVALVRERADGDHIRRVHDDDGTDHLGPCRAKEIPRPRESLVAVRESVDSDLPVGSEPTVHLTGRVVGHRDGLLTLAVTLADGTEDIVTVDLTAAGVSVTGAPPRQDHRPAREDLS